VLTTFSGRPPSQDEGELSGFIGLLQSEGVKRYCEIGARHGDTFHEVMLSLPVGSRGVAVDLPGGLWGTHRSRTCLERVVADLNGRGYRCSTIFGDSHTEATRKLVAGRGPYDAILIDGDHTLDGVTRDWLLYKDLAPLVAFHDIVGTGCAEKRHGKLVEVPMLWASLRERHEAREFVSDGSRMGIGALWTR
jgi:hypothetical protein